MEVQLFKYVMETFPNVAVSVVLFFFIYKINSTLVDLRNSLSTVDRELEYLKVKLRVLQESLDKIKEDSIRTTVQATSLKERLDRAGINGVTPH